MHSKKKLFIINLNKMKVQILLLTALFTATLTAQKIEEKGQLDSIQKLDEVII